MKLEKYINVACTSVGATATQLIHANQLIMNPTMGPWDICPYRAILPVIGKLEESSEKHNAMNVTSKPPIGHAIIDKGPANCTARNDENNHPEPSIELSEVIKVA